MDGLLIPVSMLAVKLGRSLEEGSPDFLRAEQAIWSVSVFARSVADKSDADWADSVPSSVQVVVLNAAYRVFKNPDRYIQNQAYQFMGQIDPSELRGNIFMSAELEELAQFRANAGMWTQSTTRFDPSLSGAERVPVEGSSRGFLI